MKSLILALFTTFLFAITPAVAQSPIEIGRLTCQATDVKNLVLVTKQNFDCTFRQVDGPDERYVGEIKKVGVDLSIKRDLVIVWTVVMVANAEKPGSISGTYTGASADASAGAGLGARALVGRGDNAISLKPFSVAGIQGGGVSLGIERFVLTASN